MYVSKEEIAEKKATLDTYWETTIPVPNTHKIHSVTPTGQHHLLVSEVSSSRQQQHVRIREEVEDLDESVVSSDDAI